jgi:hypothetical protein
MRSIFYILSDDHIGSTPKPAPSSQAQPDHAASHGTVTGESDDVVVDMEVSGDNSTTPGSRTPGGLSSQLKRKSGDLFSGTSKQRVLSQTAPESLH